jgi:hypothetical protein
MNGKVLLRSIVSAGLILFVLSAGGAADLERLTGGEAEFLVNLAVDHQIEHLKKKGRFSLDQYQFEPDQRFYSFEALGVWSREPGSAVIGHYAVNRTTAEVWNRDSCELITFPALEDAQEQLRRRHNISVRGYEKLRYRDKPCSD